MAQRRTVLACLAATLVVAAALLRLLGGDDADRRSPGEAHVPSEGAASSDVVPAGDAAVDAVARAAFTDAAAAEESAFGGPETRPFVGRIYGRVVDEVGGPVVGATIALHRGGEAETLLDADPLEAVSNFAAPLVAPTAKAIAAADGGFVFEGVAAGRWALSTTAPGRCSEFATPAVVTLGAPPPRVAISLRPARRFDGRVRDSAGSPVADAIVRWRAEKDVRFDAPGSAERRTDAEGLFTFDDVGDDAIYFAVRASGFAASFSPFDPSRGRAVEITLQPPAVVRGRVVAARTREGVPDVRILLAGDDENAALGVTTSGADGSFECRTAPTGQGILLVVRKPGWSLRVPPEQAIATEERSLVGGALVFETVNPGDVRTVEVVLESGASARGRVVDAETGIGLPGATVRLRSGLAAMLGGPRRETVRTADHGAFAFTNIAPGDVVFFAEKEGWFRDARGDATDDDDRGDSELPQTESAFSGLVPRRLEDGGCCEDVVIKLRRGVQASGVVVDDAGRPTPLARVSWSRMDAETFILDYFKPPESVVADAEGRFVLGGLPPAVIVVRASHPDHPAGGVLEIDVRGGAPTDPLRIVVSSGAVLAGKLLYPDGRPAAGVRLQWHAARPSLRPVATDLAAPEATCVVGADGAFRLPGLPEGEGTLGVHASSRLLWRDERAAVEDGAQDVCAYFLDPEEARRTLTRDSAPAELRLVAAAEISGTVVDDSGAPRAGVTVRAEIEGILPADEDQDPFVVRIRSVATDPSGAFRIHGLRPGTYALSVEVTEYRTRVDENPRRARTDETPTDSRARSVVEQVRLAANRRGVAAGTTGLKLTLVRGG